MPEAAAPTMERLALGRYRFTAVAEESIHLPGFAGATLRGALGHALRELSCMTGQPECQGCPLLRHCRYPALFEPKLVGEQDPHRPTPPPPYVIRSPVARPRTYQLGQALTFEMALIGLAPADRALIVQAWQRALKKGLGTRRGRARLVAVEQVSSTGGESGWAPWFEAATGQWSAPLPYPAVPAVPTMADGLALEFVSPVRLQHRGRLCLPEQLNAGVVIGALKRRLQPLLPATVQATPAELPELTAAMRLYRWERQSSRQGRAVRLDGLVGRMVLQGPQLSAWWPWLWLGQYTHLGKNVSHGLGQYRLLPADG